ncbi:cell division protein FtsQ/DivIB [Georgenia sp. AZ-5]|uniref:cell division protein FtsQ/DivIB n=1 Tax=Georgenia sp. AZ-5 TaxID=3367526 RepID=UPI00375510E3
MATRSGAVTRPGGGAAGEAARRVDAGPIRTATRRGRSSVSTGLTARMAERDAAARRLVLVRVAVAAGVVAVLGFLAWVLLASPWLALEADGIDVRVEGTTVDEAAVRTLVEPAVGTPLLRVSTAGLAEQVSGLAAVKEAQVSRAWPNGLSVDIVARVPVAAAPADGGWALLDGEGVQVMTVPEVPEGLPEVTVPLGASEETGPALEAVLTVLGALPEDLLGQVAQAGASGPAHVTFTLADGATVRWGSAKDNELKTEVLRVLRQQPAGVYDVTVPRSPTTA